MISKFVESFYLLANFLLQLLESNLAFSRYPASFNENQRLYEQIPIDVAHICLETLLQRFDDLTEASSGLNLSKAMLNSPAHTRIFIVWILIPISIPTNLNLL